MGEQNWEEYVNDSWIVGNDEIYLGIFNDQETKILSLFFWLQ